jgi:DNA-binding PadR family transcriptional regulator
MMPPMPKESVVTSPRQHWALAVLCLLRESAMHPYEMRRLLKQRHKDERLVLKPGSLYNAVDTLNQQGLIEEVETSRDGRRPHRTIYRITTAGKVRVVDWITTMVVEVRRDVSSFAVALDHLVHLTPAEAANVLDRRRAALKAAIAEMETVIATVTPRAGRINLIEVEHDLVLCRAQFDWLGRLVADMRAGRLDWDLAQILSAARRARSKSRSVATR